MPVKVTIELPKEEADKILSDPQKFIEYMKAKGFEIISVQPLNPSTVMKCQACDKPAYVYNEAGYWCPEHYLEWSGSQ